MLVLLCLVLEITAMIITKGYIEIKLVRLCLLPMVIFHSNKIKCFIEIQHDNRFLFVIVIRKESEFKFQLCLINFQTLNFLIDPNEDYLVLCLNPSVLLWKLNKNCKDLAYFWHVVSVQRWLLLCILSLLLLMFQ